MNSSTMLPQLKTFILPILCILLFADCGKKNSPEKVKITVTNQDAAGEKIEILTTSLLNFEDIALSTSTADSLGKSTLEFEFRQPLFAYIKSGEYTAPLYLNPGDELNISIDSTNIRFSGDGADINDYLSKSAAIRRKFEMHNGVPSLNLNAEKFLVIRDSTSESNP